MPPRPEDSCELQVRVTPRSSRNKVEVSGDVVRVWVTAPPAEGQANEAVVKLLAKALKVAPSCLSIIRGDSSRDKSVWIDRLSRSEALARLTES